MVVCEPGMSVFHFRNDVFVCRRVLTSCASLCPHGGFYARDEIVKRHLQNVDFDISALLKTDRWRRWGEVSVLTPPFPGAWDGRV